MKTNYTTLVVFLICIFAAVLFVSYCYAGEVKTVEGLIERVDYNYIRVRGRDYNISGVPLRNPSGEDLTSNQLKIDRKVDIFFEDDKITSVLIYDENMVQ